VPPKVRFTARLYIVLARSVLLLAVVVGITTAGKDAKSGILGDTITGCYSQLCYYEFVPHGFQNNTVVAADPGVEFLSSEVHDFHFPVSADFTDAGLRLERDRLLFGVSYFIFRFAHSRITGFDLISSTWNPPPPPPPPPPCPPETLCSITYFMKLSDYLGFGFTGDSVHVSIQHFDGQSPTTPVVLEFRITTAEAGALAVSEPDTTAILALAAGALIVIRRQRRVSARCRLG